MDADTVGYAHQQNTSGRGASPALPENQGQPARGERRLNPDSLGLVALNHIEVDQTLRNYTDPEDEERLAHSVRTEGLLQPLLLNQTGGKLKLVGGGRRLDAARRAGLVMVPALIRENLSDDEAHYLSAVEGLQRRDLNRLEEVDAVLRVVGYKLSLSEREVVTVLNRAEQTQRARSKDRDVSEEAEKELARVLDVFDSLNRDTLASFVKNKMPIRNKSEPIKAALREGKLDYSKVASISRVKDEKAQSALLAAAIGEDGKEPLSLREVQAEARALTQPRDPRDKLIKKAEVVSQKRLWRLVNDEEERQLGALLHKMENILRGAEARNRERANAVAAG